MSPVNRYTIITGKMTFGGADCSKFIESEVNIMKIIKLCHQGSCCPAVKVADDHVEIGEKDNTCVLTMEQWEILKDKILSKKL